MNSRKLFAAAVAGIAAPVALAVAIGTGQPASAELSAEAALEQATTGRNAAIRDEAERLYARWAGTQQQRQAAEVVVAYRLNGELSTCMQDKGYKEHRWERTITGMRPVDSLEMSLWLMKPNKRFYLEQYAATAWSDRRREEMSVRLGEIENQASLDCQEVTVSASDAEVERLRAPETAKSLSAAWSVAFENLGRSIGAPAPYLSCIQARVPALKGVPPIKWDSVFDALRPAPRNIPLGSEAATPAWQALERAVQPLTEADWSCRKEKYLQGIKLVPTVIVDFERERAAEIAEMETHWVSVEATARSLGWAPDRPFASLTPPHTGR